MWELDLFKVHKPIIAMLHLDPLPGDPRYNTDSNMRTVIKHAKEDLKALQNGGVDGVLISNEFSLPYERQMSFVTPAAISTIVGELKSSLKIPFGIDCISDALATIETAAAVEADFVRGTFSGIYVGDGGLYNNDFSKLLRRKSALGLDNLKMFYFINPESDKNLDTRDVQEIANSTIFKSHPDGLCISAKAAGKDVSNELIKRVKLKNPNAFVICNTGCNIDTIEEKLEVADAAIVGTYFKVGGNFESNSFENVRVDQNRVRTFMDKVINIRAKR
ncbi:MAG: BtpA/SgcQ family protein [Sphaerochaetaceae bacterium]|nr:BtpA/SgcQ family protein [Sphaerochaetaceae bacterium]